MKKILKNEITILGTRSLVHPFQTCETLPRDHDTRKKASRGADLFLLVCFKATLEQKSNICQHKRTSFFSPKSSALLSSLRRALTLKGCHHQSVRINAAANYLYFRGAMLLALVHENGLPFSTNGGLLRAYNG